MFNQKEYMSEYYQNHKEKLNIASNLYQKKHREEIKQKRKEYLKQYRLEHKQEIKNRMKTYRQIHKNEINELQRKYLINPIHKLIAYYRNRIREVLKRNTKSKHTQVLIGCSIDHLKFHLESRFVSGMSWENYGDWHVDHIRPCSSFDLSKKSEQLKCFHYSNLQPLWAKDNLIKNDNFNNQE